MNRRKKRWHPPWPVALIGLPAALVSVAVLWTEAVKLLLRFAAGW